MSDGIPEPVWPEDEAYPAYRVPEPMLSTKAKPRSRIDEYVLSAVVATGTVLVQTVQGRNRFARKASEF